MGRRFASAEVVCLVGLAWATPALALPKPTFEPHAPTWDSPVSEACASSGLRLEVREDHRAPVVTLATVVEGGSASDPVGKEGLAHLAEHLWFRAPLSDGASVEEHLDTIAVHNAFTTADEVLFLSQAASTDLPTLLSIEAARYRAPFDGLPLPTFEAERQIVAQEVRQNHLDDFVSDLSPLYAHLFPAPHPYARFGVATPASVLALTLDDVRGWFTEHLDPRRISLHIAGDVTGSTAQRLVMARLPDPILGVPTGTPRRSCPSWRPAEIAAVEPAPTREPVVLTGHWARPTVLVAWTVPAALGVEHANRDALAATLGKVMGADCWAEHLRLGGVIACAREVTNGQSPQAALDALLTHTEWTTTPGMRETFGRRWAVATLEAAWGMLDDAEASVSPLATGNITPFLVSHLNGSSDLAVSPAVRTGNLDADEERAFVQRWLTRDRAVRAVIRPAAPASLEQTRTFELAVAGAARPEAPPESLRARALPVAPGQIDVRTLPSGLTVQVLPRPGAPMLVVDLRFRGGFAVGAAPGLVDLVDAVTWWGPRNLGEDLTERQMRAGIQTWEWRGESDTGYLWTATAPNLGDVLALARSRLADTHLDTQGNVDVAELLGKGLERWLADPRQQVAALADARLFDGNPWIGHSGHAQWRVAQNLPVRQWDATLLDQRQAGNSLLTIVGAVDAAATFAAVEQWLGAWPIAERKAPTPAWLPVGPLPPAIGLTLVNTEALSTARIAAECRLEGAAGDPVLDVVERLAAGLVKRGLRDASGLAYDPWAAVRVDPVGGPVLALGASVAPGSAAVARNRLESILGTLGSVEDAHAVQDAVAAAATSRLLSASTTRGVAELVAKAGITGGVSGLETWADRLVHVDVPAVQAALTPCTSRAEYVVMGPANEMRASLAESGLPLREVDWEAYKAEVTGRGVR